MNSSLRGVNLGGWLILEKWMTPSVFAGTEADDEYTFMQTDGAHEKIERHRQTFITQQDFAWLARHHITAIRIPVGYWLLDGDPPYASGIKYLDWAFDMAESYGLRVLLDIHGLPGSQNGNDHSGRIGAAQWQKDSRSRRQSLVILQHFAERYAMRPSLWGIEVINEPNAGAIQHALRQYYRQAYRLLCQILPPQVKIVYSDAWSPRIFAFTLLGKQRAVMDVHLYHMATHGATTHSLDWYYKKLARRIKMLKRLSHIRPIIIGEWSGVISGETIGSLPKSEADRLQQEHFELQTKYYTSFAGAFMWNYKTEGTKGVSYWDFRSVVENSVTPGPIKG